MPAPIISSLLDLDLYKLTVGNVIFSHFREVKAKYRMTVRNGDAINFWNIVHSRDFERELKHVSTLSLTKNEADYLRSLKLFSEDYIQFLSDKPMQPKAHGEVFQSWDYQNNSIYCPVPVVSGLWCRVMLYEIFCLSISNELYARNYCSRHEINMSAVLNTARTRLTKKIDDLAAYKYSDSTEKDLNITEFGTRRRLSADWQNEVVRRLWFAKLITGTSNVWLSYLHGIPCRGTFGHELPMGMQGIVRIQDSQYETFDLWYKHYGDKLAIALNDTLGTDKFILDFPKAFALKYKGLRHDSGDPREWTKKMLDMYYNFDIDAHTKTLMFSDGLNIPKAIGLHKEFYTKTNLAFGIGTDLTNDSFIPVPQVVMKIVECNGQPVAKISNNPAKACSDDPVYLTYIKHVCKVVDDTRSHDEH